MAVLNKRTTVYLEKDLHRALRIKAAMTERSISELINELIRDSLSEDAEDLKAFQERENDPVMTYEELLASLEADGKL